MRKLLTLLIVAALIAAGAGFIAWAKQRPAVYYLSDLRSHIIGQPASSGSAHAVLIRPELYPMDFQSLEHLRLKLDAALKNAQAAKALPQNTLVVLPDHIGTWLLATGEKAEFYQARDRLEVRDWLLLGNPVLAIQVLLNNLDADRLDEALLRMKAVQMAQDYQTLFAKLAKDYSVSIVAGSILLPEPSLEDGKIKVGEGRLRNLSAVFGPDGNIQEPVYTEPWPWRQGGAPAQRIKLGKTELVLERSWQPGYPASQLRNLATTQVSSQLYIRGHLSWPIGGAKGGVKLTPEYAPDASEQPGTHVLLEKLTDP